jgi:hypothetical protein
LRKCRALMEESERKRNEKEKDRRKKTVKERL